MLFVGWVDRQKNGGFHCFNTTYLLTYFPEYANYVEIVKPIGLRPLNLPYEMINFSELDLTAQVEKLCWLLYFKKNSVV